jgi:hypothetical protein
MPEVPGWDDEIDPTIIPGWDDEIRPTIKLYAPASPSP